MGWPSPIPSLKRSGACDVWCCCERDEHGPRRVSLGRRDQGQGMGLEAHPLGDRGRLDCRRERGEKEMKECGGS